MLCLRFIFNRAAVGVRGSSFTRAFFLTAQPQACAVLVLQGCFFLTAQPQACAGLVLQGFFFNRAAVGLRGSSFTRGFFLTTQPQACTVLVLHRVNFFFSFVGDLA